VNLPDSLRAEPWTIGARYLSLRVCGREHPTDLRTDFVRRRQLRAFLFDKSTQLFLKRLQLHATIVIKVR
jgi:hypothetical protein